MSNLGRFLRFLWIMWKMEKEVDKLLPKSHFSHLWRYLPVESAINEVISCIRLLDCTFITRGQI